MLLIAGNVSWVQLLATYAPSLLSLLLSQVAQPSSSRGDFLVPFARTATKQRRAFSIADPTTWNDLPSLLRLSPRTHSTSFYTQLKTFLYDHVWLGSASV